MLTVQRLLANRSALLNCRAFSSLSWATVDPKQLSGAQPHQIQNLEVVLDPLNGEEFISAPLTQEDELTPFVESLGRCPKTGLHNPFKNPERYRMYGDISAKVAAAFRDPEVVDFLARLTMRVSPKSYTQAMNEVVVTRQFFENFSGDQVRFMARSFGVSGDHLGQTSQGYRWPFGPVALITPFNFPLEIPILQLMGALYMGNKPVLKVDSKVSIVMEQLLRLLHHCGMPATDVDFINSDGPVMSRLLDLAQPRNTLFTGSSKVAEMLALKLAGKCKLEDAGFDWKILGPDVSDVDYVAWQSDQDAYACSGQKCSAQSILFMHSSWREAGLLDKLKTLAARRRLDDLTIGPVLTWTTEAMIAHAEKLAALPGAKILFGAKELSNHTIPKQYGAIEPTAVFVPLDQVMANFELVTQEVFGPFQVVTEWTGDEGLETVLDACERMEHHLTAAVVTKDETLRQKILGRTVNGTTYAGLRARTTGAPQNHWFGPAGDPRGAGIGTPEAIKLVWSCHREIISDIGPTPEGWTTPECT